MKRKLRSIYELAELAGVSYATVSRVLNGRGRTSESARKSVLALAEKHGFRPRMQARRTTVALMYDADSIDLGNEYSIAILTCLLKQLSFHDLSLELYSKHSVSRLRSAMIDAVIALPWDPPSIELTAALSGKLPTIVPNQFAGGNSSTVMSDHAQSGQMAAEVLFRNGHRSVGIIAIGLRAKENVQRLRGFQEFFSKKGFPVDAERVCDLAAFSMLEAIERLKRAGVTGFFLATEGRTAMLASALRRLNLRIPNDISLVAMESWELSRFQDPPFTAVQQPFELIASKTVDLLLDKLASGDLSPEQIVLDNQLIERDSVQKIETRRKGKGASK